METNKRRINKQTILIIILTLTPFIAFFFLILMLHDIFKPSDEQPVSTIDQITQQLSDKYGTSFEYLTPDMGLPFGRHGAFFKADGIDEEISVGYKKTDDGIVVHDNYLAAKYAPQTRSLLQSEAGNYLQDVIVFYDVAPQEFTDGLDQNASFSTFISDPSNFIATYIVTNVSSFGSEDDLLAIAQNLNSIIGSHYLSIVIVVFDDSTFANIDEEATGHRIVLRDFIKCLRLTREDDGEPSYEWLERGL